MITLIGKEVTAKMKLQVEEMVASMNGYIPTAAIVRIGERPDDLSYEKNAIKKMTAVGMKCEVFAFPEDITEDFFDRLDEENGSEAHYHTEEYYQDINTLTNLATTSLNDLGVDINNVHRKAESVMADYYRDMVKSGKTYNVAYRDQNDNDAYKTMMDKSGMEMARLLGEVLREL